MKLTTARLKRLIKEELEAVMQEDQADYKHSMMQIKKIMSHGADPKKYAPEYPLTKKAAFKAMDEANISATDQDIVAKALGIKGNLFNAMVYSLLNYAAATSSNDKQAAMKIETGLNMTFKQALESIVKDNPNKRSFLQKTGSFLTGKGFKE